MLSPCTISSVGSLSSGSSSLSGYTFRFSSHRPLSLVSYPAAGFSHPFLRDAHFSDCTPFSFYSTRPSLCIFPSATSPATWLFLSAFASFCSYTQRYPSAWSLAGSWIARSLGSWGLLKGFWSLQCHVILVGAEGYSLIEGSYPSVSHRYIALDVHRWLLFRSLSILVL